MKVVDGVTTRTLWSGADEVAEVAEMDGAGNILRRFIPDGSGAMDGRLASLEANGTLYWHHTDHQGSVIATSNAAGVPVSIVNYSPNGELGTALDGSALTAPPTGSPFGYTGRQYDPETGLWQYRARYYHSQLGQFLSHDPIGTKDDPNLYLYVGNDPVNRMDPTGRCAMFNCWSSLFKYREDGVSVSPWSIMDAVMRGAELDAVETVTYIIAKMSATVVVGAEVQLGLYVHERNFDIVSTGYVWALAINGGFDASLLGGGVVQVFGPPEDQKWALQWQAGAGAMDIQGGLDGIQGIGASIDPSPFKFSGTVGVSIQRHHPHDVNMTRGQVDAAKRSVQKSIINNCGVGVPCL